MSKLIYIIIIGFVFVYNSVAQNIAITDDDSYTANPSAMLDVKSTSKGVLVPRLTSAQRLAVSNPATGLLVFDTTEGSFFFYNGTSWANLSSGGDVWSQTGTQVHLTDPNNNVGVGTSNPQNKLVVKGDASTGVNEAIFAVVSPEGDTLFAVYKYGTRVYIYDDPAVKSSGSKGGFAVGGFTPSKAGITNEYLRVTPDSVRIYIEENPSNKTSGNKGGFAVGGFTPSKSGLVNDYLSVNSDSINVSKSLYIPRMTTTERDNLGFVPSEALIIYNTTDKCMEIYENGVWSNIWCFNCAPAIIIQPQDQTICSGSSASFNVSATGTSLHYQWQQSSDGGTNWSDLANGGSSPMFSDVTTSMLNITNIPGGYTGFRFRCYVTASCDPVVYSGSAGLYFGFPSVTITSQPTNQQISTTCTAAFSVSTSENGLNYQWQESTDNGNNWIGIINGGASPTYTGANSSTLNILNAPNTLNGNQYRCVIDNPCGTGAISTSAVLSAIVPVAGEAMNVTQTSFLANCIHISSASYFIDVSVSSDFSTFVSGYNNLFIGYSPSYTVTGLAPGVTYYYRMRASFACTTSLNSNTITVTTTF